MPSNTPEASKISQLILTRHPSATSLPLFNLEHRLLIDTESLLQQPNHVRRYTQFLSSPHLSPLTFIGSSAKDGDPMDMAIIQIPAGQQTEDFFSTVVKKMEALWSFRMAVRIEGGQAFEFEIGDKDLEGNLSVRIGDVRVTHGQGQGRIRGVVVELQRVSNAQVEETTNGVEATGDYESSAEKQDLLHGIWDWLTAGSTISKDNLRFVASVPGIQQGESTKILLARQYMNLLAFARG